MNKTATLLLSLTLGLGSLTARAESVGTISTLAGKVYRHCQILKVEPDGVSFIHSKGAAKVLFMDMPKEWRGKLGYNPAKAEAYEREIAARRQAEIDARAARQAELGRALALAQQMEINRLQLAHQQALALIQANAAAASGGFAYAASYTGLPALGPIWDGRSFHNQYRSGNGLWNGNGGNGCQLYGVFGRPYFGPGYPSPYLGNSGCKMGRPGGFIFQVKP